MARIALPAAPAFLVQLRPPILVRLGALVLAGVFLGAGIAVIATAWPAGAMTADQAAAAPDSTFFTAGTVVSVWAEGADAVTHMRLAGAPNLDFRIAGNALDGFTQGDFVVVEGAKVGNQVEVHSARLAADPVDVAAPYLALGGVLAAIVAVDFLVRWSRGAAKGAWRLRLPLPRLKRSAPSSSNAPAGEPAAPAAKP